MFLNRYNLKWLQKDIGPLRFDLPVSEDSCPVSGYSETLYYPLSDIPALVRVLFYPGSP
jgi:hypothetical protein